MNIDVIEQNIADMSKDLLKILLCDKTTGKNIKWATNNYEKYGAEYGADQEIQPEQIIGIHTHIIQPRVSKNLVEQAMRTRDSAEVFTPSWMCNHQNNLVDDAWFGRSAVFNETEGTSWKSKDGPIVFPEGKTWEDYVDARRLEMSCGEAPYLVSRYDAVSGKAIPLRERIGLLDRKLRIVSENTSDKDTWYKWATRAFQSTYAYEYQGDNVLLARENLLLTFIEYYTDKFGHKPTLSQTSKIATIIAWNVWQMDGITLLPPRCKEEPLYEQMMIFDVIDNIQTEVSTPCKIYDWRAKRSLEFRSMVGGERCG